MTVRNALVAVLALAVLAAVVGGLWLATQRSGAAADAASHGAHAAPAAQWICPMHPAIVADRPGSCPICGMDLVLADAAHGETAADDVEGLATVSLGATRLRRIGAATTPVTRTTFRREVRAAARIEIDETRLHRIHSRTGGFVEKLYANAVGEKVREGEPLLDLYSPEILGAQQEFLVALRARARLELSEVPEVAGAANSLVSSARRRLTLLDLKPSEIDEIAETGEVRSAVPIRAPVSGTILSREIAQGSQVEPGTVLLELADLSRVWAIASVFESDLPYVREGQEARLVLAYLPGREFRGKVARVYPVLDRDTRTAQVRVEIPNPAGELKPGMFGDVALAADLGERLSVPVEAVMETGTRTVAFVDAGDGSFAPREVAVGMRLPDKVEILSGLDEGERVLASGNFFVDAESRLRAALEATSRPAATPAAAPGAAAAAPAATPSEHRH